tara:strand:+ start:408 stop:1412 length:1005 start_codon:yes stop_codon:yes gene_type:complete
MKNKKNSMRKKKSHRNIKRLRKTNHRMVYKSGGASKSIDLPLKTFKMGTELYKGSLGGWATCNKVLTFHDSLQKSKEESSMDPHCTNKTSIYLGPSKERSQQYWKEGNAWLVFRLKKDLTILDLTPENLKEHHMRLIVDKAVSNNPTIEDYLYNLEAFGGLSNLCLEGLPGKFRSEWHDWRGRSVKAGLSGIRICNPQFKDRLTELFCLIFGIEKTVKQQLEFLQELLELENAFLMDPKRTGWTATPVLVKNKTTKLYDFVKYFLHNLDKKSGIDYALTNQRLSYYGFDQIFLTTVCASGFVGYYYPERASVHDDAGEEIAIFRTNEYLECVTG